MQVTAGESSHEEMSTNCTHALKHSYCKTRVKKVHFVKGIQNIIIICLNYNNKDVQASPALYKFSHSKQ